ncbi:MAG: DUF481 domain-containing protein [Verrucomicrobiota bacterium]
MPTKTFILGLCGLALSQISTADTIITKDGSQLSGTITLIDKGVVHIDTAFAGSLQVKQDQIASFETEDPIVVRLESGTVMAGPIQSTEGDTLKIKSEDGVLETSTNKVAASWSVGSEDPEITRNRREWRYEAGLDIAGKTGNTEKFGVGADLKAALKGPNDNLEFFFEYEQEEENGNETDDRIAGGASYESFFSDIFGWYIRTELEQDNIDNVELRSTTGAGLSYRLINKDNQSLVARTGVGYEYTGFTTTAPDESSATIDFGIAHSYTHKDWFIIDTDITYVPQTDDFTNYRIEHDTGIVIPLGSSQNWKIRIGVENEYESQPATNERLDTTYYTRMIYSWK